MVLAQYLTVLSHREPSVKKLLPLWRFATPFVMKCVFSFMKISISKFLSDRHISLGTQYVLAKLVNRMAFKNVLIPERQNFVRSKPPYNFFIFFLKFPCFNVSRAAPHLP